MYVVSKLGKLDICIRLNQCHVTFSKFGVALSYYQTMRAQAGILDVDENTDGKFRPLVLLETSAWAFIGGFCAYTISSKILCASPYTSSLFLLFTTFVVV